MLPLLVALAAWLDRAFRTIGVLFRLVVITALVALLGRVLGIFPGEMMPSYWLVVVAALATIAIPVWAAGYNSRVNDQYQDDIEAAKAKRDRVLK